MRQACKAFELKDSLRLHRMKVCGSNWWDGVVLVDDWKSNFMRI
jgi:hypothetical protein